MKITLEINEKGLPQRVSKDVSSGWLDNIKPVLPDVFKPLVNNYNGKAISSNLEVIPISGQMWHSLTQNEKEDLLELVEFTGVRAEDYVRNFTSMLPKDRRKL